MTNEGLHLIARAAASVFATAKIYYEDRVESVALARDLVDVKGNEITIHFVLDQEQTGKISKIELLDANGVLLKSRPFTYELVGDYNLYIAFRMTITANEVTADKYLGGVVNV